MLAISLKQRGDTIVEVMIVLAVLGSAIGISYTTANRSLLNTRQAQESAEAARIAQTQIEALYTPSSIVDPANPNYLYLEGRTFCMNGDQVKANFAAAAGAQTQRTIAYGDFSSSCVKGLYHYSIRYSGPPAHPLDNDKFTVVVVWDDVLGQGKDTVTLTYRIHKPIERDDI